MKDQLEVIVREGVQEDLPLVYNSWLKQYRESPFTVGVSNGVYYEQHRKLIDALVSRAELKIACDPSDPTKIYSWACGELYEVPVIHFVYTKKQYRDCGLAKLLLASLGCTEENHIITTHFVKYKNSRQLNKDRKIVYNPYLIYACMRKGENSEVEVS